jgi:hypothetical protein
LCLCPLALLADFSTWLWPHCNTPAEIQPPWSYCIAQFGFGMGAKMIIDLDSWETGYADGQLGRPSQCPADLDRFSYSGGYGQARAGAQEASRPRRAPPSSTRALQRRVGRSRLIIL